MAKKSNTDVVVITPELQSAIDKFSAVKSQIDAIGADLLTIKITDASTLSVAQQNLSKANDLVKLVDEKRKGIKEKPLRECQTIDEAAKYITKTVLEGIASVKQQVVNWETERLKKEQEKKAELEAKITAEQPDDVKNEIEIIKYINNKAVPSLNKFYEASTTPELCDKHYNIIEANYKPQEFFGNHSKLAYDLKEAYLTLIMAKKIHLEGDERGSFKVVNAKKVADNIVLFAKSLERGLTGAAVKEELEQLETESALNKTKNIRYNWKFELVDASKLTPDWTALNESVVKEYLKENKESLKDGEVINGVKFYKEISATA